MPRLRPVRTKEEAAAVPEDQPVLIDVGNIEEPAPAAAAETETKEEKKAEAPQAAPPVPEPEPEPPPKVEPDKEVMRQRHEELRAAEELNNRLRQENERLTAEANRNRQIVEAGQLQGEYDVALSSIASAQSDREAAKHAIKAARAQADENAELEAISHYNNADYRLNRWEERKAQLEDRIEQIKNAPPPPQPQPDPNANVPQKVKAWMDTHRSELSDEVFRAKANFLYLEAQRKGISVHSDKILEYVETGLGLRQEEPEEEEEYTPSPKQKSPPMSAPPSRESVSMSTGRPISNKIILTPEQREAARIAKVDEITYAKNLIELQKRKNSGYYDR